MRKVTLVLGILLLALTMSANAAGFKGLEVVATRVDKAPVIDGELDDAAWLEAALNGSKVSGFTTHDSTAIATDQSIVYVAYDDSNMYVAWVSYTPNMDFLVADVTKDDGPLWEDDDVEVYVNPHFPDPNVMWYQYIVNSKGTKFDFKNNADREFWNSGWEAAAKVGDIAWTAEMRIPFEPMGVMPKEGDTWGINFTGHRVFADEWISWSTTTGMFAQIDRFGKIVFGGKYLGW